MRLLVDNDNKDLYLNFFKSDLLIFLLMATTYNYGSNQKNEFYIMNTFTKPTIPDFYKFYELNEKEINFINENIIL